MKGRAGRLYEDLYQDPKILEEIRIKQEEESKRKSCLRFVDFVYGHLGEAFKNGETQTSFKARQHWRSSFECANKILKQDNIDLLIDKNYTGPRDLYKVTYNRKL